MKRNNLESRSSQKIIIFTEDKKSARYYIRDFVKSKNFSLHRIVIVQPENHAPWGLWEAVQSAVKQKFVFDDKHKRHTVLKDDIFWLVFDADQHPKIPDTFNSARQSKIHTGIGFSAICFEIWLMMHFHNRFSQYPNYDALRKSPNFRTYFQDYDKGNSDVFAQAHSTVAEITGSIETAKKYAEQLRKKCRLANPDDTQVYTLNPYCNLNLLFDAIETFFGTKKLLEKEEIIKKLQNESFLI